MKILTFTDMHYRMNDSLGFNTPDGLTTRIHQKMRIMEQVVAYAKEHEVDAVFNLGDTFHSMNPSDKLRAVYARTIASMPCHVFEIMGNHGTDGRWGTGMDLQILGSEKLTLISSPVEFQVDGQTIAMIPEVSQEEVEEFLSGREDIPVFGHFGVTGVRFPSGSVAEGGVSLKLIAKRTVPMWLGHIHLGQSLCDEKVHYTGATARCDFGDRNINPRCCLIEKEPGSDWRTSYLYVDDIDLIHISISLATPDVSEMNLKPESVVKIAYEGTRQWFEEQDVAGLKKSLYEKGAANVFISYSSVASDSEHVENVIDTFDFVSLVEAKAKNDEKDSVTGLEYLAQAQEALEYE